jgi:hypothetical protein
VSVINYVLVISLSCIFQSADIDKEREEGCLLAVTASEENTGIIGSVGRIVTGLSELEVVLREVLIVVLFVKFTTSVCTEVGLLTSYDKLANVAVAVVVLQAAVQ